MCGVFGVCMCYELVFYLLRYYVCVDVFVVEKVLVVV